MVNEKVDYIMAKPKAIKNKTLSEGLIQALRFVSVAQKENGTPSQTHCIINNHQITAFNGVITAGCKITEDLSALYPHSYRFIEALERCDKELSITQLEGKLSVKSEGFSAFVPCYPDSLPVLAPDPALCAVSDVLRQGFDLIAHLADEENAKEVLASIQLQSMTMSATNGFAILQFYHGINLPQILLPKAFVTGVVNTKKVIKAFGYSGTSCTFWFEDESWIKTQLFNAQPIDIDKVLNIVSNPVPLPNNFVEGLNAIQSFSQGKDKEKKVYFAHNMLQSHRDKDEGACFKITGIQEGPVFGINLLKSVLHCTKTVDFNIKGMAVIFGNNVRGIVMGVRG